VTAVPETSEFTRGENQTGSHDPIAWVRLSTVSLPLAIAISDAKVFTGRQRPMTEIALLFVEVKTAFENYVHAGSLERRGPDRAHRRGGRASAKGCGRIPGPSRSAGPRLRTR
jgi:hypothetical protein